MTKQEFLELSKEPDIIPFWVKWKSIKMLALGFVLGVIITFALMIPL